jgi:hypothetical protein
MAYCSLDGIGADQFLGAGEEVAGAGVVEILFLHDLL